MISIGNMKLNSIDFLLVVNREFSIVYSSRFDSRMDSAMTGRECNAYVNRNFFEAYPTVKKEDSSVLRCMTTGEVVVKIKQSFRDIDGNFFCTNNITVPFIRKGKIIGVVELIKDVTAIDNMDGEPEGGDGEFNRLAEALRRESGQIGFESILTRNQAMKRCIEQAKVLARSPNPTLLYGETGTGKEMFAQAMIQYSGMPRKKIVVQNCAAVPEGLLESILFGTAKGAYTGAENRRGLFEEADGGIFFLDELNSLPYHVQGKLLRVLQDGTFRPVGSNVEKKVDVKVIAAMNVDPLVAIEKGILRKDLFYRLSGGMIYLPPLRERKDDVLFYIDHYLKEFCQVYAKKAVGITDELREVFLHYDWDGNVRELRHIIESMISILDDDERPVLEVKQLPAYLYERIYKTEGQLQEADGQPGGGLEKRGALGDREPRAEEGSGKYAGESTGESSGGRLDNGPGGMDIGMPADESQELKDLMNLKKSLEAKERELIEKAIRYTGGNKTKAGALLGIPRQTLKYKIDKWNISVEAILKE